MAATAAAVIEYLLSTLSSRGKGEKKRRSGLHLLTAAAARVQREGEKETKPLCTQRAKAEWEVLKLHHAQNYYVTMRRAPGTCHNVFGHNGKWYNGIRYNLVNWK